MSRELQKDVEASSKIARIGAMFGQHREVSSELFTSVDVQAQGKGKLLRLVGHLGTIGLRDFGGCQRRFRLFRFPSGLLAS